MSAEGRATEPGSPPDPGQQPATTAVATEGRTPPHVHSEAGIFAILGQYAVMQIVWTATGIIRNKIVAFKLGPSAFGEFCQLQAVMTVAVTLVSFGMMVSVSRNVARSREPEERQEHLANANGIVLVLSLAAILMSLTLLASGQFLRRVGLSEQPAIVIAALLFIAAIPLEALKTNYLALLQGVLDVKGLAVGRSTAVVLATVVAVPVVWLFGFVGAAVQFFLLSAFVTVMLGLRCRTIGYAPLRVRLRREHVLLLASFGLVSMVSGSVQGLADTAVRTNLIEQAGAAANGLLQAPYTLAVTIKTIVLTSIGSVSLATIAPQTDPRETSRAIDRILNVVLPLGASALGLIGLMGVPAMVVLYSRAFTTGAVLFPYLLTADLLQVFVWVVGAPLLARGDRMLWLILDLVQYGARWALAMILMRSLGAYAVVVGYLVSVALHVALNLVIYRFRYRLELPMRHIRRLVVGLALVAVVAAVGARPTASIPATAAVALAWIAYTVHHARQSGMLAHLWQRFARR